LNFFRLEFADLSNVKVQNPRLNLCANSDNFSVGKPAKMFSATRDVDIVDPVNAIYLVLES
jgi:hypothetical protein